MHLCSPCLLDRGRWHQCTIFSADAWVRAAICFRAGAAKALITAPGRTQLNSTGWV